MSQRPPCGRDPGREPALEASKGGLASALASDCNQRLADRRRNQSLQAEERYQSIEDLQLSLRDASRAQHSCIEPPTKAPEQVEIAEGLKSQPSLAEEGPGLPGGV